MPSILVAYATKHGTTREVAEVIASELRARGLSATLRAADDVQDLRAFDAVVLDAYDAVVLGGPLYHGHWHREASRFLMRHRRALEALPLAVFALDPACAPVPNAAERACARGQLEGALRKAPWLTPVDTQLSGAALDPSRLHSRFNRMPDTDWRDWGAVRRWAAALPAALEIEPAPASTQIPAAPAAIPLDVLTARAG